MTPCEKKGYKVGDEFVVSNPRASKVHRKGVKVRLCKDDGTASPYFEPVFKKDRDGIPRWVFDLGEVSPFSEHDIITRTNGQPFATESSARQQLTAKGLQGTHEVVPHEGGYALAPKQDVSNHKFKAGDKVLVNGYMEDGNDHKYGTSPSIRKWMRKNKIISVVESDSERVEAGDEYISLSFHPSELDLVEQDDPITLQPGDYVSTEGMTEDQYHAVARAFIGAGFESGEYPRKEELKGERAFGVDARRGSLFHGRPGSDGDHVSALCGRHLTIEQVLNAANAGNTTPQSQETTMTADPITTLKQARATRDEAEQAYQQALAEAREYLGEGFALTEAGRDAPLVDGENMDDPANWREGDVLVAGRGGLDISAGDKYVLRAGQYGGLGIIDDAGDRRYNLSGFRFHHRPK